MAVFMCPTGHKIFTRTPGRWCPKCEKDYIPSPEDPEALLAADYTEDCEENQWLFFDYPLRRSAEEGLAAGWANQDTVPVERIRED